MNQDEGSWTDISVVSVIGFKAEIYHGLALISFQIQSQGWWQLYRCLKLGLESQAYFLTCILRSFFRINENWNNKN